MKKILLAAAVPLLATRRFLLWLLPAKRVAISQCSCGKPIDHEEFCYE